MWTVGADQTGLASCRCHLKPGAGIFDHDPGLGPPWSDRHVSTNVSLLQSSTSTSTSTSTSRCRARPSHPCTTTSPLPSSLAPFHDHIRNHQASSPYRITPIPLRILVPTPPVGETHHSPALQGNGKNGIGEMRRFMPFLTALGWLVAWRGGQVHPGQGRSKPSKRPACVGQLCHRIAFIGVDPIEPGSRAKSNTESYRISLQPGVSNGLRLPPLVPNVFARPEHVRN